MNNDDKKLCDFLLVLLSKLHCDYLLLNRVLYKVKHQFRKQRQFQYAMQIKKHLFKLFNQNKINICNKTNDKILSEFIESDFIKKEHIEKIMEILEKLGEMLNEMLKLKLYLSYSIVMLGIVSRAHAIFDYILTNKDKIIQSYNKLK